MRELKSVKLVHEASVSDPVGLIQFVAVFDDAAPQLYSDTWMARLFWLTNTLAYARVFYLLTKGGPYYRRIVKLYGNIKHKKSPTG
jgi:hypothetical protein